MNLMRNVYLQDFKGTYLQLGILHPLAGQSSLWKTKVSAYSCVYADLVLVNLTEIRLVRSSKVPRMIPRRQTKPGVLQIIVAKLGTRASKQARCNADDHSVPEYLRKRGNAEDEEAGGDFTETPEPDWTNHGCNIIGTEGSDRRYQPKSAAYTTTSMISAHKPAKV